MGGFYLLRMEKSFYRLLRGFDDPGRALVGKAIEL